MRFCWPRWLFLTVVVLLGFASMLGGCGNKGPLYLPQAQAADAPQTMDAEAKARAEETQAAVKNEKSEVGKK